MYRTSLVSLVMYMAQPNAIMTSCTLKLHAVHVQLMTTTSCNLCSEASVDFLVPCHAAS